jgi:glucose-6-phosphate 1-dehydrogenase
MPLGASVAAVLGPLTDPVAVYLALPPRVFLTAIESLGCVGLPPGSRVVVEKPFGDDLASARALNALLTTTGLDTYRVDHVLGMHTTQGLVALRRSSPVLDRMWSGAAVEQVEIRWEETLALEGRAGFFDATGALKDVVQNHVLQLLALVAMEVPADGDHALHQEKLDALRSVGAPLHSRRARYRAGSLADGREVPAYTAEEGIDPDRGTETFAEVVFEVATPRWRGTRFALRAGKALARRRKLVALHFRGGGAFEIGIDGPDDVVARFPRGAGDPLELRAPSPGDGLPAYANVLLDVLRGTDAWSVSAAESEEAWRIVDPVVAAWDAGTVRLEEYPAGSAGPGRTDPPGRPARIGTHSGG